MRSISLSSITVENFKSFATPTMIWFSQDAGLKFLTGANQVEPRLGANGAGKSSLWDALCFCLYGSGVKGHRASSLTTWGAKQIQITATLQINDEEVEICRQGSPDKILIEGQPAEQKDVDSLIGLTRSRFLQAVLFGQNVQLFLDLSIPERGILLDDVLDLGTWIRLSDAAGKRSDELTAEGRELDKQIAHQNGRLESLADTAALEKQIEAWSSKHDFELAQLLDQVEAAEQEQAAAFSNRDASRKRLADLPNLALIRGQVSKLERALSDLNSEYKVYFREQQEATKTALYYEHTKQCATCQQAISPVFARERTSAANKKLKSLAVQTANNGGKTNSLTKELEGARADYDAASRKREFFVAKVATAEAEANEKGRRVESISASVLRMAEETNPHEAQLAQQEEARSKAQAALSALNAQRRRKTGEALKVDFWRQGFKRVRLFLIKRILAQMEVETENAASALGLPGWQIKFTTETETKSGTAKQGVQVQVFKPGKVEPWSVWSGGEEQRIKMAISIGIAAMIQRMAGIFWTLEVWDEPTANLSPEGIEDLLECMKDRAESTGKSLWLSDHNALQYSGFKEARQVAKTLEGSQLTMLTSSED